jgi:hypothetical protein
MARNSNTAYVIISLLEEKSLRFTFYTDKREAVGDSSRTLPYHELPSLLADSAG